MSDTHQVLNILDEDDRWRTIADVVELKIQHGWLVVMSQGADGQAKHLFPPSSKERVFELREEPIASEEDELASEQVQPIVWPNFDVTGGNAS